MLKNNFLIIKPLPIRFRKHLLSAVLYSAAVASIGCSGGPYQNDTMSKTGRTETSAISANSASEPTVDLAQAQISSSEHNFIRSLLFQWWQTFEAPDGTVTSSVFDQILDKDTHFQLGKLKISNLENFKTAYNSRPAGSLDAHHIENLVITPLGNNAFALEAIFISQTATAGQPSQTKRIRYQHKVKKRADGNFVFTEITAAAQETIDDPVFKSSFIENRARGSINYYLGIVDQLNSPYSQLPEILSNSSEIHGMFDPKKATFNQRGDGALIGHMEIANWLSSRKNSFSAVAHQLEAISLKPLGQNRFETTISTAVQAWPLTGKPISTILPIKITLKENGGKFMLIEKIER